MEFFWQKVSTDIPFWKTMKNLNVTNRDTKNGLIKKQSADRMKEQTKEGRRI
jgi:hypothetical protein